MGILDKMGAWYSLDGERLGQGREKVRQLMKDDPRLFDKLDHKVREVAFTPDGQLAPAAAAVAATVMAEG
jgi:recombination protein RecA